MLSFDKIFGDWFADASISNQDLEAGTRDHLDRLRKGNEAGRFDALIAGTEARFTAYFGYRSDASTGLSAGKGQTLALEAARDAARKWLTGEGRDYVSYKIKDEARRLRFYPQGATEYHNADYPEWPGLLERYDKALAELGAGFEADFKTTYTGHRDALLAALKAQSGQKQVQAEARVGTRAERDKLTRQLSRNARQLGLDFEQEPAKAQTFFDRKFFNQHQAEAKPGGPSLKPALT
ncbi:hypothetical protein [Hymenobacter edaphi]|uniref:Uncharacterized protein n=1 Tax=Hymenobacter edaphi TaxID=2211146 RepID=A0A328BWH6_9BACT|nr:hypothetical protein [Hymenobacter edaphi]RAK69438.1 hypothetical protein DLM85_00800 [Hymenobacter edaphi]